MLFLTRFLPLHACLVEELSWATDYKLWLFVGVFMCVCVITVKHGPGDSNSSENYGSFKPEDTTG